MGRRKRSPEEQARREKTWELLHLSGVSSTEDIQSLFKETIIEVHIRDIYDLEVSDTTVSRITDKVFPWRRSGSSGPWRAFTR